MRDSSNDRGVRRHSRSRSASPNQSRSDWYAHAPTLDQDASEIRLLRLLPATSLDDEIQLQMSVASLDDPEDFEALSYTWGESVEHRTVRIDGRSRFPVTDNLYYALRRLRQQETSRVLWIDAICVNQRDMTERSQHVQIMGEIYAAAERVVVWMGEPARGVNREYHLAKRHHRRRSFLQTLTWSRSRQSDKEVWDDLISAMSTTRPHWWTRLWCVQELAQANAVQVQIGKTRCDWESFLAIARRATKQEVNKADSARALAAIRDVRTLGKASKAHTLLESDVRTFMRLVEAMAKIRTSHQSSQKPQGTLLSLTRLTSPMQSSDIHDRIYSLLGLIRKEETLPLRPDYRQEVRRLFTSATLASILSSGNLDILSFVSFTTDDKESRPPVSFPTAPKVPQVVGSWTVNFANVHKEVQFEFENASWALRTSVLPEQAVAVRPGRLDLRGVLFDRVGFVENSITESSAGSDQAKNSSIRVLQESYWRTVGRKSAYRPVHEKEDHRSRPLAHVRHHSAETLPQGIQEKTIQWMDMINLWDKRDGSSCLSPRLLAHCLSDIGAYAEHVSSKAIVFVTERGHIGFAPYGVREGDFVVIAQGARLPVLVRTRSTGLHSFLGFGYVHGTMRHSTEVLDKAELMPVSILPGRLVLRQFTVL